MLFHFVCFVSVVLIAVSAVSIGGCSQEKRYEVLTFFFTGVPEPGSELDEAHKAALGEKGVKAKKKKRRLFFQEPKYFIHGPYASRECGKCHADDSARSFQFGGAKTTKTSKSTRKRYGPRLAYPLKKLCVVCHSEKSEHFAKSLQLSMHEPVATGQCVKCHDPHKAKRQYMLQGKNSIDLCARACHTKDNFMDTVVHRKDRKKDCLECHNPHVGKTAQLLRADYDEWQQFDGVN